MNTLEQTPQRPIAQGAAKYRGSCHCGAVRFEVSADLSAGASRCNCSVCTKVSQLGGIVKPEAFQLLQGSESLSFYEWGGKVSRRYFCKHCGVHCYAPGNLPELGGEFVSVNYNTLDEIDVADLTVGHWDGRHDNWQGGMRDRPWPVRASA
jgi:hypothetical protein